jgi:hypothetical protein
MKYATGLVVVDIVFMPPTTFHDITPILAFDGDYSSFSASSSAPTVATAEYPPRATTGAVVTVPLSFLRRPSSSEAKSPAIPPLSTPTTAFSRRSSAAATDFLTIQYFQRATRTV